MNNHPCTTSRRPQIGRSPRFSGSIFSVSVIPEQFSFMNSLHGISCFMPSSIKKIVHQCFFVVEGIVYCFFKFASACRIQASKP